MLSNVALKFKQSIDGEEVGHFLGQQEVHEGFKNARLRKAVQGSRPLQGEAPDPRAFGLIAFLHSCASSEAGG